MLARGPVSATPLSSRLLEDCPNQEESWTSEETWTSLKGESAGSNSYWLSVWHLLERWRRQAVFVLQRHAQIQWRRLSERELRFLDATRRDHRQLSTARVHLARLNAATAANEPLEEAGTQQVRLDVQAVLVEHCIHDATDAIAIVA